MELRIHIELPATAVGNARTRPVAEAFEMSAAFEPGRTRTLLAPTTVELEAGEIVLLAGASGSGKSLLLGSLQASWPRGPGRRRRSILARMDRPVPRTRRAVLDEMLAEPPGTTPDALRRLSLAGLGEARLWLMPARCLSAGQADRLALARLYARTERLLRNNRVKNPPVAPRRARGPEASDRGPSPVGLLIDEFASRLDRLTARVLSANLRRWVDRTAGVAVVAASAHDDLADALAADRVWAMTDRGLKGVTGG